jgi:hypothetical protein
VIKHLEESYDSDPEKAIAYYYFSFTRISEKRQGVEEMLSSVIKQLCCRRPDTPVSVQSLEKYQEKGQRPDRETLEDALAGAMHGFSELYLVLDALDECPSESGERDKLLRTLLRLRHNSQPNLHLFLTSRRENDIEFELKAPSSGPSPIIDVDLSAIQVALEHDIGLYIDQTFDQQPFRRWPSEIKKAAKSALIKNADGMYVLS